MSAIDWSRYLPPRPLPDTGPKRFSAGQTLACSDGATLAVLCVDGNGPSENCTVLAGKTGGGRTVGERAVFVFGGGRSRQSVLIADVGCDPPPPEEIWARVYGEAPKAVPGSAFPGIDAWLPKSLAEAYATAKPGDSISVNPGDRWTATEPSTCGHPGPHGHGGLCFPCHAAADAKIAAHVDAERPRVLPPPDRSYAIRPVEVRPAQSHPLVSGGVWSMRGGR